MKGGYKYRKEIGKTRKVLLRKFKANYIEKNNMKKFIIRNMESGNTTEATGTIIALQIVYECELEHGRKQAM